MFDEEEKRRFEKCLTTGKVTFPNQVLAAYALLRLHWFSRHPPKRADGTRVKRRMRKKSKLRRAYYCEHCDGYHLTRWTKQMYEGRWFIRKP